MALILTELDRLGRLTSAEKGRLKAQIKKHGSSPLLKHHRAVYWGDHTPPAAQFWWFREW